MDYMLLRTLGGVFLSRQTAEENGWVYEKMLERKLGNKIIIVCKANCVSKQYVARVLGVSNRVDTSPEQAFPLLKLVRSIQDRPGGYF